MFHRCLTERLSCSTGLKHDVSQSSILIDGQNEIIINKRGKDAGDDRWADRGEGAGAAADTYVVVRKENGNGTERDSVQTEDAVERKRDGYTQRYAS